jgi:hypothetical protein
VVGPEGIGFLGNCSFVIVVSGKGIERSQLHPARTEISIRVRVEATDVRTDHLDPKYLIKEIAVDRRLQELPIGHVVSCPMGCEDSCAYTVAPGQDEWSALLLQEFKGGDCGEVAVIGVD